MRTSHDQPRAALDAAPTGTAAAPLTAALVAELEVVLLERQDVLLQLERAAGRKRDERGTAPAALRARLRQLRVRQDALLTSLDEVLAAARAAAPARRQRAA